MSDSRHNFIAFLWHALFLAFVTTFIDVNTVFSSLILKIGGSSVHVGLLTGVAVGLPLVTQLLFAGFLAGRSRKKPFLLMGIYLRVLSLAGMEYPYSIRTSSFSAAVCQTSKNSTVGVLRRWGAMPFISISRPLSWRTASGIPPVYTAQPGSARESMSPDYLWFGPGGRVLYTVISTRLFSGSNTTLS